MTSRTIAAFVAYALISSASLVLMRSQLAGLSLANAVLRPLAWAAVCGYGTSYLLWLYLISKLPLSVIYPVSFGVVMLLVYGGAVALLHEQISAVRIVGAVCILVGVSILTMP